MLLSEIKKKASCFLQDKYKSARLVLTDVTEAELLAEEATNNDPWGPDAKLMTRISEAAHDIDDYRRIVDVLHRRFSTVDWKDWRQPYKTLVLLEFLLTHGPEDMFEEFHCDVNTIRELEEFSYRDERGFDWGACMRSKSKRVLWLLSDEEQLKDAREKALRISREIQGFGNLIVSPSSSNSSSSARTSRTWSFGSSSCGSPTCNGLDEQTKQEQHCKPDDVLLSDDLQDKGSSKDTPMPIDEEEVEGVHLWDKPVEESSTLLESNRGDQEGGGWSPGLRLRLFGSSPPAPKDGKIARFRSLSNVVDKKKKMERQSSLGF